ncbi:MAG: potassium channel family protein [Ectothiorhodospiraceae bacterium]|jgi:hypothetical protein
MQPAAQSFPDVLTSGPHWLSVGATVTLVMVCVLLHYESFRVLSRFVAAGQGGRHRRRILVMMLSLLVAHVAEIWLFGAGYFLLLKQGAMGALAGIPVRDLLDCIYFSAVTYTTLGFGDIIPQGPIRFLAGTEALTGLLLVTWSASLTFVEMQRYWARG